MFSTGQNVSLLGIVRKISGLATYSDLYLIIPGIILFVLPYFRFSQYRNLNFRYKQNRDYLSGRKSDKTIF